MRPNKPTDTSPADREWLAFCYIADELDETAREQFEARLATDQVARECVAAAVEQTQLTYAALAAPHPSAASLVRGKSFVPELESRSRKSAAAFSTKVVSVAAACVLLALGWLAFGRKSFDKLERPAIAKSDREMAPEPATIESSTGFHRDLGKVDSAADRLAAAWADVFSETETIKTNDFLPGDDQENSYTNVVFDGEAWLNEAVFELESGASSKQPKKSAVPDTESKNLNGGI